jgi:hypothetical protein
LYDINERCRDLAGSRQEDELLFNPLICMPGKSTEVYGGYSQKSDTQTTLEVKIDPGEFIW